MDAIFDENFTSPLCMPDLPFQGALKLRGINTPILNTDTITEVTGPPIGENNKFPSELISSPLTRSQFSAGEHNSLMCQERYQHISMPTKGGNNNYDHSDNKIKAYFTEMAKPTDLPYSEYLHIEHIFVINIFPYNTCRTDVQKWKNI